MQSRSKTDWFSCVYWGWLFFMVSVLMVTTVGFAFGISISYWHWLTAAALTVFFEGWWMRVKQEKEWLKKTVVALFVTGLGLWGVLKISGFFVDMSYDGRGYHQIAVKRLAWGWNPFRERLTEETTPGFSWRKWINVYPKGAEVIEAVLFKASGKIEEAKGIGLIFSLISLGFVTKFLSAIKGLRKKWVWIFGALLILNPVSLTQWLTFYNDGLLYSVFLSLMAVWGLVWVTEERVWLIPAGIFLALAWSFKMTGVIYGLFVSGVLVVGLMIKKKGNLWKSVVMCVLGGSILGGAIWGFNPYITNLIDSGDPFYFPVSRKEIVINNVPSNLLQRTVGERLLISSISRSSGVRGRGDDAVIKTPFTFNLGELKAFESPDVLVGGWGPLFAGAIVISFIIWWLMLWGMVERKITIFVIVFAVTLLGSCLLNGAASYARYVPQWWLFPIIMGVGGVISKNKWLRCLGVLLVVMLIINVLVVMLANWGFNYRYSIFV